MSSAMSGASATPSATNASGIGSAQNSQGISLVAFLTALATSLVIFGVQIFAFILFKDKLARILWVSLVLACSSRARFEDLVLIVSVNPKHTWSPNENEQKLLREATLDGFGQYSNSEIERSSISAVSTPTSFYDTYKPFSLYSYLSLWLFYPSYYRSTTLVAEVQNTLWNLPMVGMHQTQPT